MTDRVPTFAGWYLDSHSGGTKYWDGSRWTCDTRPRRRPFAAAAHHRELGLLFIVVGVMLPVLGFITFWLPEYSLPSLFEDKPDNFLEQAARLADPETPMVTFLKSLGTFLVGLVIGPVAAATGVYLLRGQGPTTQKIELRLATERSARRKGAILGGIAHLLLAQSQARSTDRIQALRELENLREEGVISDDEFQEEKDRLLGN